MRAWEIKRENCRMSSKEDQRGLLWETEDNPGQWVCLIGSREGQSRAACSKVSSSDSQAGQSVD